VIVQAGGVSATLIDKVSACGAWAVPDTGFGMTRVDVDLDTAIVDAACALWLWLWLALCSVVITVGSESKPYSSGIHALFLEQLDTAVIDTARAFLRVSLALCTHI
jgi:hypothetical protein